MSIISKIAKSAIEALTVNAANRELKDYSKTAKAESKATAKEVKKEVKELKKEQRQLSKAARSLKSEITKKARKSKKSNIRLYMILSQIVIDLQKDLNSIKDMKKSHVKDWNTIVRAKLDLYRFKFDHPDQKINLTESDPDLIEEKLEKIGKEDEAEEAAEKAEEAMGKAEEVAEKAEEVTDAIINHDYCQGRWGSDQVTMIASGDYSIATYQKSTKTATDSSAQEAMVDKLAQKIFLESIVRERHWTYEYCESIAREMLS